MNHEDSQMMKVLETIADRMIDMHLATQRGFAEQASALESVQRKLDALMVVKAGEQLSLLAIVTTPEAVVPNEDEAMPVVQPTIVQDKPSPRKKHRLPDDIRVLGQQFRVLHEQADAKAEERAKVLAASKGRETKESVALLVDEQDLRTEARKFQQQYDKERRPFGNDRKSKKATK